MMTVNVIKSELYKVGIELALRFLKVNAIPPPQFYSFEEIVLNADRLPPLINRLRSHVISVSPLVGGLTGFYRTGYICVNIPKTALPVDNPGAQRWSYPRWKTDRTAVGVVAHELGHYVEDYFRIEKGWTSEEQGEAWRALVTKHKKRVTSYEPSPGEAWAESFRLFSLNPWLLKFGIPERYTFIRQYLKPSEKRTWREVLNDHPAYVAAGNRWIGN